MAYIDNSNNDQSPYLKINVCFDVILSKNW